MIGSTEASAVNQSTQTGFPYELPGNEPLKSQELTGAQILNSILREKYNPGTTFQVLLTVDPRSVIFQRYRSGLEIPTNQKFRSFDLSIYDQSNDSDLASATLQIFETALTLKQRRECRILLGGPFLTQGQFVEHRRRLELIHADSQGMDLVVDSASFFHRRRPEPEWVSGVINNMLDYFISIVGERDQVSRARSDILSITKAV